MCGIAGIVDYELPDSTLRQHATVMRDRLLHRGPDSQGIFSSPGVAIAHTRLALIDISGGAQPLVSQDRRYTITYNGEVYNYRDIRNALRSEWRFATDSDTEAVLAAYCAWGEKCLGKFNGMFSFFIWDAVKQEGFAARDLLGIKPFVYRYNQKQFMFASEAKAILAVPGVHSPANNEAVLEYLIAPYFSGVEQPMFDGLEYLQPGFFLRINRGALLQRQWADYDLRDSLITDPDSAVEMSALVLDAVESAMIADVPVGVYLSGGFDSTLLTALARKSSATDIEAFTIRFAEQGQYDYSKSLIVTSDDTPHAVAVAEEIGVRHSIVDVNRESMVDGLRAIAVANDALPAWEQEFAQHYLAQAASAHYKAVLVGDAADETHYGYQFLLDQMATQSPLGILRRFDIPVLRKGLIDNPFGYFDSKYKALCTNAGHSWNGAVGQYLATTYLIVKRWLPRLLHNGDIHAMSSSLEARVPFGDIYLLDMARRVHPTLGYHNDTEKWFLRKSAKGLMPEASRTRIKSALPKDQGVGPLYQSIARSAIVGAADFLGHFLDIKSLMSLCHAGKALSEQERALLFRTISLCYWSEEYGVNLS